MLPLRRLYQLATIGSIDTVMATLVHMATNLLTLATLSDSVA
jgi:hypothetical protein